MDIKQLGEEFHQRLQAATSSADLEELRNQYLGRKRGIVTSLLKDLPKLPADQRSAAGKSINDFKKIVEDAIEERVATLSKPAAVQDFDWTLPGYE